MVFSQPCMSGTPEIIFDGTSLSNWVGPNNAPAAWKLENGYFEVVPKAKNLNTATKYGDCQLHIEWASPQKVEKDSQGRGNSGVFLMNRYEVQVLDSYSNNTYADGQASALYGQHPPLVNAARKPGEWQVYDIIFRRPKFDDAGNVMKPARMTIFHNGVLVHHDAVLIGPGMNKNYIPYRKHGDTDIISLQDHGNLVRYKNVWIVPLASEEEMMPDLARMQYHTNNLDYGTNARPSGVPITKWRVNDMARPKPPVITAGTGPGDPSSDAVVLFDGTLKAAETTMKAGDSMLTAKGKLISTHEFTNAQLHFEFGSSEPVTVMVCGMKIMTEPGSHKYDIAASRRVLFGGGQALAAVTVLKDGVFCFERRNLIDPSELKPEKIVITSIAADTKIRNVWARDTKAEAE